MCIPLAIIKNAENSYLGNLVYYFKAFMNNARNLNNSYHNFRHSFHVLCLCYEACVYYREELSPRQCRNLLIAGLYHDFDHPGRTGNDDLNIEFAVRGLRKHVHSDDVESLEEIIGIIRATEFPFTCPSSSLTLQAQILRDADASQSLSDVWIQQVIFGLSAEMNVGWKKAFAMQENFLQGLTFTTEWAKWKFPQEMIDEKIQETRDYLALSE